ncbi:MAG: hypothetical protein LBP83_04640 [Dysgonamonadaceae bacterium]|jgi:outer membrane protein W|nr:hypothetical protein [Dysgonamonadaceae bacterium]
MKKTFLIMLVAVFGVVSASAQFEAGKKTLSGKVTGFNFGYTTGENDYKEINVDLGVAGSYFIIDKLAIEALVGLSSNKVGDGDAATGFEFGIGARYYFWNALYGGLAYKGAKFQDIDLQNFLNVEVGYDYYITDNVYFEPAIYFNKGFSDINKNSTFGLSIGIGVNF